MSKVTQEQLDQLIENLKGTMSSIDQEANQLGFEEDDLTIEQLEYLDSEIFCCEECGWWCSIGDLALGASNLTDMVCEDCAALDVDVD